MNIRLIALISMSLAIGIGHAEAQEIYVPNYGEGTVSVIDATTFSVTSTITLGGSPEGVALSPLGDKAFVSMDGSTEVAVINTSNHSYTTVTVPARWDTMVFRPSTGPYSSRVYVTSYSQSDAVCDDGTFSPSTYEDQRRIAVIDSSDNTLLDTYPILDGIWQIAFSADGLYAFGVACQDHAWNQFVKIDLSDGSIVGQFTMSGATGPGPSPAPAIPSDLGAPLVALVSRFTNCLNVIDLDAMSDLPGYCDAFAAVWGVRFNAAGDRAYVADADNDALVTLNTENPSAISTLSAVPLTAGGTPAELIVTDFSVFVTGWDFEGLVPTSVTAFDIVDPNTPVAGCSVDVGFGGWALAASSPDPWACPTVDAGTGKKVKGSGHLTSNPKIHVNFHASFYKAGTLKGKCNIEDHTSKPYRQIKCVDVTELTISGNVATIKGHARDSAFPNTLVTYTIQATDDGKPKKNGNDLFSITTSSSYSAGPSTLKDGDIKIKKK